MKNLLKFSFLVIVSLTLTKCQTCTECTSSLTGWKFNNPDYGNYIKGKSFEGSKPPGGMVAIEGGTFTMGQVQDDVMFEWNTTPKKMHAIQLMQITLLLVLAGCKQLNIVNGEQMQ